MDPWPLVKIVDTYVAKPLDRCPSKLSKASKVTVLSKTP